MDKNNQRLTRNKRKSESVQSEIYTTLSTGRVSKQRLPLTPMKAVTNKRKRKADMSDDDSSSDDDQEDEDYDDKYVNRKLKQENGSKRSHSSRDDNLHDEGVDLKSISHMLPTIQIPYDSSKSQEELDFLIRLNTFMSESLSYPKTAWGLRDGEFEKMIFLNCVKTFFLFQSTYLPSTLAYKSWVDSMPLPTIECGRIFLKTCRSRESA